MPKKQIHGRCRLCDSENWLVDSHIIPNFLFKPLKKADGHFLVQSTDPEKRTIRLQKGITEYLLCAQCDNVRLGSRYEEHVAKVLFGGHPLNSKQSGRLLIVEGYDYKRFKNGLLSILWRMSLSSDPFFSKVQLEKEHEERLRVAFINDTEFQEEEYPILVTAPLFDGQRFGYWMRAPDFTRTGGNRLYHCVISGLLFSFFVGSDSLSELARPFILRRKSWPLVRAKIDEIPFLLDTCLQLGRANAKRRDA